jgi:hypothetical protein
MEPLNNRQIALATLLTASALLAPPAKAALVTYTDALQFNAPTQSIWGPGQSAASFGASGATGSASTVRLSYAVGASSGTVAASFGGALKAQYQDSVYLSSAGATGIDLLFGGGNGNFRTALGAHLNVSSSILNIPITILDRDYNLDVNRNFTSRFAAPVASGTDSVQVTRAAFGPNIVLASAQAGVDGEIRETARLDTTGILGSLIATHLDSGTTRSLALDLDTNVGESLLMDLALTGLWELQFVDLRLENFFEAEFFMDLVPFAEYFIGFNCGDPGTDADNNANFPFTGCGGDGRAAFNLASVKLLDSAFALNFGGPIDLAPFTLQVLADPLDVPEPGSLLLLLAAVPAALSTRRRFGGGRCPAPNPGAVI